MAEQSSKTINIRCARRKPAGKRTTPTSLRQAWMQLYEQLSPDEVDAIFMICGYEISPTGKLSRRYIAVQLDKDEKAMLEAQAKRHGHTAEEEAAAIIAVELATLAKAQSDEKDEPAAHE